MNDDDYQNNLRIHKRRIIGETKGNKILLEYTISELFDLVESECYLISMKEHFENEKQDVIQNFIFFCTAECLCWCGKSDIVILLSISDTCRMVF